MQHSKFYQNFLYHYWSLMGSVRLAVEELVKMMMELGLNAYKAKVYIAMLGRNSVTASEVSKLSGIPRQMIYDVLNPLQLKGRCCQIM